MVKDKKMEKNVEIIPADQIPEHGDAPRVLRVAAYCRVSTDEERQLGSFENQIEYFSRLIEENGMYELVRIYSDEGISGTSTRSRRGFNEMIADCEAGRIDLIITKSISRFARNTQDSLNYTRMLRNLGIGIYFEKEGINTLESSGELLLTLFSCFAQEESRSISENTAWGIRSKFQQGIPHLNATLLLGYDKGPDGGLVINEDQAATVRRIYRSFLEGYSLGAIARSLNADGVPGVKGTANWCGTTITHVLENEKYKGAMLMQKTYTASFLTGHSVPNTGQLPQYYVADDHPAIIDPGLWEAAQEESRRRRAFREGHGLRGISGGTGTALSGFYSRIFCRRCGQRLQRIYRRGVSAPYWWCPGCGLRIDESLLRARFCDAFNEIVRQRASLLPLWEAATASGTPLQQLRVAQMRDITAPGPIPYEIPHLTQAVLEEAWAGAPAGDGPGAIEFRFFTCTVTAEASGTARLLP